MILKIDRVRIGYCKIFRVWVGYRVPVGPCIGHHHHKSYCWSSYSEESNLVTESKEVGWLEDPTVSTVGAAESILPSLFSRLAFSPLAIGLVGREVIEKKPCSTSRWDSNGGLLLSPPVDLFKKIKWCKCKMVLLLQHGEVLVPAMFLVSSDLCQFRHLHLYEGAMTPTFYRQLSSDTKPRACVIERNTLVYMVGHWVMLSTPHTLLWINSQSFRRHASGVHFALIHFGWIHFGKIHFGKINFWL